MTTEVYHMFATDYIRIPAHELLRREFCASPVGTLIEDAVRGLAARIGRSAGAITPALKRLAHDGWISYLSDGRGTLIEVLRSDQQTDRSVLPEPPPIEPDSAPLSDESPVVIDQVPDRSFAASPCDQVPDRSPCMVVRIHDQNQEEESARSPLFERLLAHPRMDRRLAHQIAAKPLGTLADFEADLKIAHTFARDPFFFTVAKWRDSQRVIAPEESHDAYPARSATASGTRRRTRTNQPTPCADPATDADYAALLAEICAARPLTAEELGLPVPGQRGAAYGS